MRENNIYFTCIVTCYNRENEIQRSLQSILNQNFQNFEIIVVDDCSVDGSIERIEAIKDSRIRIIKHTTNRGQNAALNTGLENAIYEFIAFLDSDDIWGESYLAEMTSTYLKYPKIGFCYANLINGPIWNLEGENKYADVLNQGFLSSMITITAKKSAIEDIGGFDLKYRICQDDDFCFRLSKRFSFKVIEKPLAQIIGAESSMTRNFKKVAEGWLFLFENYRKEIIENCGRNTYSKHMLYVANLYFEAFKIYKGLYYYLTAAFYLLTASKQKFPFSINEFWIGSLNILRFIKKNYLLKKTTK